MSAHQKELFETYQITNDLLSDLVIGL